MPLADAREAVLEQRRRRGHGARRRATTTPGAAGRSSPTRSCRPGDFDGAGGAGRASGWVPTAPPPPRFPAADGGVKTSAAWLIERAGFAKGFGLPGPAALSTKHTLAVTNRGARDGIRRGRPGARGARRGARRLRGDPGQRAGPGGPRALSRPSRRPGQAEGRRWVCCGAYQSGGTLRPGWARRTTPGRCLTDLLGTWCAGRAGRPPPRVAARRARRAARRRGAPVQRRRAVAVRPGERLEERGSLRRSLAVGRSGAQVRRPRCGPTGAAPWARWRLVRPRAAGRA